MWQQEHPDVELQDVPGDLVTFRLRAGPAYHASNAEFQLASIASKWAADTKRDRATARTEIGNILQDKTPAPLGGLAHQLPRYGDVSILLKVVAKTIRFCDVFLAMKVHSLSPGSQTGRHEARSRGARRFRRRPREGVLPKSRLAVQSKKPAIIPKLSYVIDDKSSKPHLTPFIGVRRLVRRSEPAALPMPRRPSTARHPTARCL
jgi:hypothetical protein